MGAGTFQKQFRRNNHLALFFYKYKSHRQFKIGGGFLCLLCFEKNAKKCYARAVAIELVGVEPTSTILFGSP